MFGWAGVVEAVGDIKKREGSSRANGQQVRASAESSMLFKYGTAMKIVFIGH